MYILFRAPANIVEGIFLEPLGIIGSTPRVAPFVGMYVVTAIYLAWFFLGLYAFKCSDAYSLTLKKIWYALSLLIVFGFIPGMLWVLAVWRMFD